MSVTKNNATINEANEDSKLTIEVEANEEFNALSESVYMRSSQFGMLVNQLFQSVFADYEGCRIEIDPSTNSPMVTAVFNHLEKASGGMSFACTKDIDTKTKNEVVSRLRRFNNRMLNGDQYMLTTDGQDALEEFMMDLPKIMTKDRKIRWENCVANVGNSNNPMMMNNQQYTIVSFLDINKLAKKIFGENSEDGGHWLYFTTILHSVPGNAQVFNGNLSRDFSIEIKRINDKRTEDIARTLGYAVNVNGLDIIRAVAN